MERVHLLVVEDDLAVQRAIKKALAAAAVGLRSTLATSGDEAIALFNGEGKFEYQAVLTDINLLGSLNGWDVALAARKIDPSVPIIYMSGDRTDEWASKGVSNSIMLSKPFSLDRLLTAISQLTNAR